MDSTLLNSLFYYDEESGKVFWKKARCNRVKVNQEVCHKNKYGYLQVRIEGKLWMLHRLIWLMKTGKFPQGEIDHINGDRSDNSWLNLRDVSKCVNMQNRKGPDSDSTTGYLGVTFDKQNKNTEHKERETVFVF